MTREGYINCITAAMNSVHLFCRYNEKDPVDDCRYEICRKDGDTVVVISRSSLSFAQFPELLTRLKAEAVAQMLKLGEEHE